MSSKIKNLHVSEALVWANARAKYYPQEDGNLKLAYVEAFDRPTFKIDKFWEIESKKKPAVEVEAKADEEHCYIPREYLSSDAEFEEQFAPDQDADRRRVANEMRAVRRAKQRAVDNIMCNPELDCFVTLTLDPSRVSDVFDYQSTYDILKPWLSNRVQRKDLRYVLCHERHKKGGIHMHMICNADALTLERAVNVKTGREMSKNGKPLFNVTDWKHGFSTAQMITGDNAQTKVALYVLKYITKEAGKLGGRYLLTGGNLRKPTYVYGDSAEELINGEVTYHKAVNLPHGGRYDRYTLF